MEIRHQIRYTKLVAESDIPKLDQKIKSRLKNTIESKLSLDPFHFSKPLKYSPYGLRSLRIGKYRILFGIKKTMVTIYAIAKRDNAYDIFIKRMGSF